MNKKIKIREQPDDDDPMINKDADPFVTCQKCGTNKREYYANIDGVITCGHCIYLSNKKSN
jgi:late competence protein required for DNA uptake (superfamily II DNA/RNA helicase)